MRTVAKKTLIRAQYFLIIDMKIAGLLQSLELRVRFLKNNSNRLIEGGQYANE